MLKYSRDFQYANTISDNSLAERELMGGNWKIRTSRSKRKLMPWAWKVGYWLLLKN